jgi:uncharacterized protein YycO
MAENITHQQLHDKLVQVEATFTDKHSTLLKWMVGVILTIVALTMTQIVSVASSLAEVGSTQGLILQSLNRVDRSIESVQDRIQEESREAEEDLKSHLDREHIKRAVE